MSQLLILNPRAGSAHEAEPLLEAARTAGVEIVEPQDDKQAHRVAAERGRQYERIICAGGDGTLHDVVNGLWEAADGPIDVKVGLIPMGTGNDLARTLDLPTDPLEAFELALRGGVRKIDLVGIEMQAGTTVAVNACVGGFASTLTEHITANSKRIWGPLAYLLGAAASLPDVQEYELELSFDVEDFQRIEALNVVVANGRTAGGGAPAAPRARPSDGMLDVVVVRQAPTPALAALAARMLAGDYLDDELILFRRARKLQIRTTTDLSFTADGEYLPSVPHTFQALPAALPMIAVP